MKILIACHCKKKQDSHAPLLFGIGEYSHTSDISFLNDSDNEVEYVNLPNVCKNDGTYKWDEIKENSKHYIWTINCPVYYYFINNNKVPNYKKNNTRNNYKNMNIKNITDNFLKTLFSNGWKILKNNGTIVIPFKTLPSSQKKILGKAQELANMSNYNWKIKLIDVNEYPFVIQRPFEEEITHLLLFKKEI